MLMDPANGMVTTPSRRLSGSIVTYTCNSGYQLLDDTPGSDVRTCQPVGNWTLPEPQCLGIYACLLQFQSAVSTLMNAFL